MLGRFVCTAMLCFLPLATAFAQVKIGLMVSATGPTSAIGIPQRNTAALLPTRIGEATVEYFQFEDGGDTTRAVQNVKKLIGENNVDALIGPSTTPNAFAILASERYARADQSVTGQVLKLIAAKPDAILIAAVGGPAVLPQATRFDQGYKGRIYPAARDPGALRRAKPGTEAFRSALRDAIEQERDVVGCQGVFNMSPTNHNGMDERARVLVTIREGKFRLLPE